MSPRSVFTFGEFTLHADRRELTRQGVPVDLGSRAMDVLLSLLRRHGQVASKSEIMADVWPGIAVEENNLTTQIATVRRALNDGSDQRYILTIPGRGYRFVADVSSGAPPPEEPPRALPVTQHSLPVEHSSFVGRARQITELKAKLERRGLITLVGPGGVGKTRLALRLASEMRDHFPDGVRLLELAPLGEGHLVAEALCRLLGVPPTGDRPADAVAVAVLQSCKLLLVLDNCEHVLEGAADLALSLLNACPNLRILATSQEAMGVAGEVVYPLPPLPVPPETPSLNASAALSYDAVRLFVDRAADALGSYELTDADALSVGVICRRLDGMPLATELAAARLRMLKPAEIAARLEDVFSLLTSGSRTSLPRQQTLRATLDWSFSLLAPPEQTTLRRLSVFKDGCPLDGAIAVVAGDGIEPGSVFDLVSALVAKSLLVADTTGQATRFRLLETTRQYAAAKLSEAGEGERIRLMAVWLLHLLRRAEVTWPTEPTDSWLATYAPEAKNLRAALDWAFSGADTALGISLVASSGALAEELSLHTDLRRWTALARAALTPATPGGEVAQILYLHTLHEKRLGPQDVPPERQRAIALFRELGDKLGLSRALRQTAIARAMPGPADPEVMAMLDEAVALLRPLAPHKDLAIALAHTGSLHFLSGDHAASRRYNEEALLMREALGDRSGALASSLNLAELMFLDGDVAAALRYAEQAEAEARHRRTLFTLALILSNLAGYRLAANDVEAALRSASEALSISRAIGQSYLAVMCLEHMALAHALGNDIESACTLLGYTNAHYAAAGQARERQEQAGYDRIIAILRQRLGSAEINRLLDSGGRMTADQADMLARGGLDQPPIMTAAE